MDKIKLDISPAYHAIFCIISQFISGLLLGDWFLGGAIGCTWFLAREHTQAEYRWISKYGSGKRSAMPWYGGFTCQAWDFSSVLDFIVPIFSCILVYLIFN